MKTITFDDVAPLIRRAIDEDLQQGDVTSEAIFPLDHTSSAGVYAKDSGIFCGGSIAQYVYGAIDTSISVELHAQDGARIHTGDKVLSVFGSTKSILEGERILLNFLQRMCGIATRTANIVSIVRGGTIKILDTRKTLPGFRLLDKYAVAAGGGTNHRMGLYDMVMIKDNHIQAAGSITNAVNAVRKRWQNRFTIEVETTTIDEVSEAVSAGADIIMLDNMERNMIQAALEVIGKAAHIELSGNMNTEKIAALSDLPVDYISIGALTHSVEAFDLSMKFRAIME